VTSELVGLEEVNRDYKRDCSDICLGNENYGNPSIVVANLS
jgi:hypothetical protein